MSENAVFRRSLLKMMMMATVVALAILALPTSTAGDGVRLWIFPGPDHDANFARAHAGVVRVDQDVSVDEERPDHAAPRD